ncbi:MAG: hypothetical protein ACI9C1_001362 [Candidatus Aldehydirespiratoraceae bacterium]|jgi:hypothetical protein
MGRCDPLHLVVPRREGSSVRRRSKNVEVSQPGLGDHLARRFDREHWVFGIEVAGKHQHVKQHPGFVLQRHPFEEVVHPLVDVELVVLVRVGHVGVKLMRIWS